MAVIPCERREGGQLWTDGIIHYFNDGTVTFAEGGSVVDLVEYIGPFPYSSQLRQQVAALEASFGQVNEWNKTLLQQRDDLQAQLEAAVHLPDLRSDLERVAAERDAAREEVRGLQVRAEQAEGDARQATAKMRHLERESARWEGAGGVEKQSAFESGGGRQRAAGRDREFIPGGAQR
ncbi:MAG UNVERIFIED_CONTAM: hypothetical protein LVR18_13390 [Planctomycetaceae bacterium]